MSETEASQGLGAKDSTLSNPKPGATSPGTEKVFWLWVLEASSPWLVLDILHLRTDPRLGSWILRPRLGELVNLQKALPGSSSILQLALDPLAD